ncbi:hypothetical protein J8273_7003 [Carpediemonas membranifera]|uniref:Uncharacterized protein n=1 Tax=Carpediemonas membranifera TaxID=201153 RepID=A0A8J6AT18_9EUKA|nr:hypothetical protein J8273_7003 [Carpediemonas membranifera]|eukprot:KAG9390750.1 hypothetical protein J8273_7003 [Carpediemonas membranifera]
MSSESREHILYAANLVTESGWMISVLLSLPTMLFMLLFLIIYLRLKNLHRMYFSRVWLIVLVWLISEAVFTFINMFSASSSLLKVGICELETFHHSPFCHHLKAISADLYWLNFGNILGVWFLFYGESLALSTAFVLFRVQRSRTVALAEYLTRPRALIVPLWEHALATAISAVFAAEYLFTLVVKECVYQRYGAKQASLVSEGLSLVRFIMMGLLILSFVVVFTITAIYMNRISHTKSIRMSTIAMIVSFILPWPLISGLYIFAIAIQLAALSQTGLSYLLIHYAERVVLDLAEILRHLQFVVVALAHLALVGRQWWVSREKRADEKPLMSEMDDMAEDPRLMYLSGYDEEEQYEEEEEDPVEIVLEDGSLLQLLAHEQEHVTKRVELDTRYNYGFTDKIWALYIQRQIRMRIALQKFAPQTQRTERRDMRRDGGDDRGRGYSRDSRDGYSRPRFDDRRYDRGRGSDGSRGRDDWGGPRDGGYDRRRDRPYDRDRRGR